MSGGMASIGSMLGMNPGAAGTGSGGLLGNMFPKSPDPLDPRFNPEGTYDPLLYQQASSQYDIKKGKQKQALEFMTALNKPKPFTGHKKTPGGKFVAQAFDSGPMVPSQEDPGVAGPATNTRERLISKRQKKKKMHSAGGLLA
jgi:hypothetical protein